jgi:hypothetical protein
MMKQSLKNYNVHWNEEDQCFIASAENSDLIGCGHSSAEALQHLENHLKDELETPRKTAGRPKKFKQKIGPEVSEETIEKLAFLRESFPAFESQGDIIDEAISYFYQSVSRMQNKLISK